MRQTPAEGAPANQDEEQNNDEDQSEGHEQELDQQLPVDDESDDEIPVVDQAKQEEQTENANRRSLLKKWDARGFLAL